MTSILTVGADTVPAPGTPGRPLFPAAGSFSLSDVLQIEDHPELLLMKCRVTGIPLWTTVRFAFLRSITVKRFFGTPMTSPAGSRWSGITMAAGKVLKLGRSLLHNELWMLSHRHDFPIMLAGTGARLSHRGGRYFNCLTDHFVEAAKDKSLALESLFDWQWPFPRQHRNILIHTPFHILASRRGARASREYVKEAEALIDFVSSRSRERVGWEPSPIERRALIARCAAESSSLAQRYQTYHALFTKLGTRLLIKEEACYGGADNAAMLLAARHLGIPSAEYQHGQISSGHDGYNFAPTLRESPAFSSILPDTLLTYGSWWGEQINAPVTKNPIGYPHRAESIAAKKSFSRRKSVLVLGEGFDTRIYLSICEQLARTCTGYEVIFRPHPLERSVVQSLVRQGSNMAVRVDTNDDIYESFRQTEVLFGEVSTGLFEAVGIVPRIFIWDTPKSRFHVPVHPFTRISDPAELSGLLRRPDAGRMMQHDVEAVWAPNWRANYLRFIEGILK